MSVHVCKVDSSRETGSIVACSCGLSLGPYQGKATALAEARAHREATKPVVERTPEMRERVNAYARKRKAEKRALDSP